MKISLSVLKKHYSKAVEQKLSQFTIKKKGEKAELLTAYAKYMIEYLDGQYKARRLQDSHKFELVPQDKSPAININE